MSATPAPVPAAVPAPTPPKDKDDDLISRMMRRNMFDWDEPAEPVEPIPLSEAVQPLHYDLALRPDLQRLRSEGEVTIKCQATTPVREVTLSCHSSISIRHLSLIAGDRTHSYDTSMLAYSFLETSDSDVKLDRRRGQLVLKVPDDLDLETFDILMAFSGNISEQPRGLYHCSYSYTGDDKCMDDLQHYAVFTGSNAHHVFPCFDDARFKATVRLSIIGWLDRKALSNTPVDEEAYWSGQTKTRCMRPSSSGLRSSKITRFKTTHAIALDELTFALGEFKAVNSGPVTVWTTPEHERASFAAEVLAKALPELARFGAPSKVDILAVGNLDGEAQARPGLLITLADRLLVDTAAPLSTQIDAGTLLMQETLKLRHPHGLADFLGRYIVAPKCFPEWETRDTFWSDRERDARRFKAEDLELGSSAMMAALYREKGEEPFLAAVENGNLKTPTEAPKLVRISATSWHADGPGYQAILLSDCWAFARAGHHPLSVALDLIKTLAATSDSHVIWDAIVACVDDLPELGGVVAQDAERMANQLGLTRQSQVLPARLQAIVVRLAAKQPQLLVSLQEAYDGGDIAPEIRGEVFRAALCKDPTTFQQLKDTYLDTLDPSEKADALYALFGEPSIASRAMDLLRYGRLDEPDVPIAVAHLARDHTSELWSWIKDDWHSIHRKYDSQAILRNALIAVKQDDIQDLTTFATEKGKNAKGLTEMLAELPERLAANARDIEAIAAYPASA